MARRRGVRVLEDLSRFALSRHPDATERPYLKVGKRPQASSRSDEYDAFKPTLREGKWEIVRRDLRSKELRLVHDMGGLRVIQNVPVSAAERTVRCTGSGRAPARALGRRDRGALFDSAPRAHAEGHRVGEGRAERRDRMQEQLLEVDATRNSVTFRLREGHSVGGSGRGATVGIRPNEPVISQFGE